MSPFKRKTLLFIEPSLSDIPFILKAKDKKDCVLVIFSLSNPEPFIEVSSIFFQTNIQYEDVFFDLIKKVERTFTIDELYFGSDVCPKLAQKISVFLHFTCGS